MAVNFDGSTEYYTYTNPLTFDSFGNLMVSVWVKPTSVGASSECPVEIGDDTSNSNGASLTYNSTDTRWNFEFAHADGGVLTSGVWSHLLGVSRGSNNHSVWVNGTETTSSTTSPVGATQNEMEVGRTGRNGNDTNHVNGLVAELAVWNIESFGAAEAAAMTAGFSPLFFRRDAIVFYAPYTSNANDLMQGLIPHTTGGTPNFVQDHPRIIYPRSASIGFVGQAAAPPVGETRTRSRLMLMGVGV